jgi:hypothetical protein
MAPRKPKAVQLNVMVGADVRETLRQKAEQRGVSLNAETVRRLGKSLREEDVFGDEETRDVVYAIAAAFVRAGAREAAKGEKSLWINQPTAFDAATAAVLDTLLAMRPGLSLDNLGTLIKALERQRRNYLLNKRRTA